MVVGLWTYCSPSFLVATITNLTQQDDRADTLSEMALVSNALFSEPVLSGLSKYFGYMFAVMVWVDR